MAQYLHCTICDAGGRYEAAIEKGPVACNVREFSAYNFTVWRCPHCLCLHSLDAIDFAKFYQNYPIQKTKLDFMTRLMYRSRLRYLQKMGLKKGHRIIDYGCGNGAFVAYLRDQGYKEAVGYDPFSKDFSDPVHLNFQYDFVLAQDVIEHDPEPKKFLEQLMKMTAIPDGQVVIGTPDASNINIGNDLDAVGQLHQPYHRHLFTQKALSKLLKDSGLEVTTVVSEWYVDTWFPFANSAFITRFWRARGGFIDSSFEPVPKTLFFRHPFLIVSAVLGKLYPKKDMLLFAKANKV